MTITLDDVRRVTATFDPEHYNPGSDDNASACRYAEDDGTPSCIAGTVFHALFSPVQWAVLIGEHNTEATVITLEQETDLLDDWSHAARTFLMDAQSMADNGSTWGEALDSAETLYAERHTDWSVTE